MLILVKIEAAKQRILALQRPRLGNGIPGKIMGTLLTRNQGSFFGKSGCPNRK
jgi:hypothetical protein